MDVPLNKSNSFKDINRERSGSNRDNRTPVKNLLKSGLEIAAYKQSSSGEVVDKGEEPVRKGDNSRM